VGGRQKNIYVAAFNSKFLELVERCADITGLKGRQQQSQHNVSVINFGRDVTRALYTVQQQNQEDERFLFRVVVFSSWYQQYLTQKWKNTILSLCCWPPTMQTAFWML
jgi:hypothetical protein